MSEIGKDSKNPLEDFGRSLVYSGLQSPLNSIVQTYDIAAETINSKLSCELPTNVLARVQFIDAPQHSENWSNWLAQGTGSLIGTLPWFMAGHKLTGKALGTSRPVLQSGLTGFGVGFGLKPLDEATLKTNGWWKGHLYNGASDALMFSAQSKLSLLGNNGIGKLAESNFVKGYGLSPLSAHPLTHAFTGSLSGGLAAPLGTLSNIALQRGIGELQSERTAAEIKDSTLNMMLFGGAFGALHAPTNYVFRNSVVMRPGGVSETVGRVGYCLEPGDMLTKAGPIDFLPFKLRRPAHVDLVEKASDALSKVAYRDALTGLPNRLAGEEAFIRAVHKALRDKAPMSMLFIDLNNFKPVNKIVGDPGGDAILIQMAKQVQRSTRPEDITFRKGGDEFVVILQNDVGAKKVADRICQTADLVIDREGKIYQRQGDSFLLTLQAESPGAQTRQPDSWKISPEQLIDGNNRVYQRHEGGDYVLLEADSTGNQVISDRIVLNPPPDSTSHIGKKALVNTSVSAGIVTYVPGVDGAPNRLTMQMPKSVAQAADCLQKIQLLVDKAGGTADGKPLAADKDTGVLNIDLPNARGKTVSDQTAQIKIQVELMLGIGDQLMLGEKSSGKQRYSGKIKLPDHTPPSVDSKLTGGITSDLPSLSLADEMTAAPALPVNGKHRKPELDNDSVLLPAKQPAASKKKS